MTKGPRQPQNWRANKPLTLFSRRKSRRMHEIEQAGKKQEVLPRQFARTRSRAPITLAKAGGPVLRKENS